MTGLIILGIVVLLLIVYVAVTYNGLVQARNRVEEAFSTMDVYLKKRWDLIPNIVETVKGYAKHEEDTLKEITQLRTGTYSQMSVADKVDVQNKVSQGLQKIMAVAEAYPDLKANENFIHLSDELSEVEEDIANARKYYNGTARAMNDKVQMFPGNLIAGMFGFEQVEMFEATESERSNVKVQF